MNRLFKSIIIEDEKLARNRLKRLLADYTDVIEIIAEAENGEEGLHLIETHKPDLIFLDIQMPGLNGFEMLRKLKTIPVVIFTTAYEEYAIKAFEQNAIDYLLKPIEVERLDLTIQKLKKLNGNNYAFNTNNFVELIEQLKPKKEITAMPVKIGDKILLLRMEEIAFFEAKEKYVFIHTTEGKEYLIDFTLTTLEEKLPDQFIRVHRAFIVNKEKIKEVQKYFDGKFVLKINDKAESKIISGSSFSKEVKTIFEI